MSEGGGMYRKHILDHYRNPRNFGVLEPADVDREGENPTCGDEIRVTARVAGDQVEEVRFHGKGCAISQAGASMLTEELTGASLDEVRAFTKQDLLDLLGIPVSPVREKCAALALVTLKAGLEDP